MHSFKQINIFFCLLYEFFVTLYTNGNLIPAQGEKSDENYILESFLVRQDLLVYALRETSFRLCMTHECISIMSTILLSLLELLPLLLYAHETYFNLPMGSMRS